MADHEYYADIYALTPDYECEPGWWKLKWRPLWRKTFSIYVIQTSARGLGFRAWDSSARNGWGRSYRHKHLEVGLWFWTLNAWIKWNYLVMAEGPMDVPEDYKRALAIPRAK